MKTFTFLIFNLAFIISANAALPNGVKWVDENGYKNCIELTNGAVRVVIEPNCGGRVLKYELNNKNVLYVDEKQNGMLAKDFEGLTGIHLTAGRFDFGPSKTAPGALGLFYGAFEVKIKGARHVQLTSKKDEESGVQLVRDFVLDAKTSRLQCKQTIINVSEQPKTYCHWGRSFVKGGGISLTPMNPNSRFPKGYVLYGPQKNILFSPDDEPNVRQRDGILEIIGKPNLSKFEMDCNQGWLGYLSTNDLLFVKTFKIETNKPYGEITACTASGWVKNTERVEIEPIGPMETIKP